MGKFNAKNDLNNYSSEANYFSLKDDGDTATVRIGYNSIEDVEGYALHEVDVNGFKTMVNCLRDYTDPLEMCPLCSHHHRVITKFFVPMYKVEEDAWSFWTRGRNFYSQIADICNNYNPVVSNIFEVTREGEAGNINTKYDISQVDSDDTTFEDLPELPNVIGTLILDKSFEELENYVNTGSFNGSSNNNQKSNNSNGTESNSYRRREFSNNVPNENETYRRRRNF